MAETFINNYTVTVGIGGIDGSSTSLPVSTTASVDSGFRILVDSELMLVIAGGTTTTWTVNRGVEGTTLAAHTANTVIYVVMTAGGLALLAAQWQAQAVSQVYDAANLGVPGLTHWYSADKLTELSDGNDVLSWPNLAQPGQAASAQTTSAYPIYKVGIVNSLPVERYGGSGWFKIYAPEIMDQQFSIFWVFSPAVLNNAYTGIMCCCANNDVGGYFLKSNGKTALYNPGNLYNDGAATLSVDTFYVMGIVYGPTTLTTRVALADDASGISLANTVNDWQAQTFIGNHTVAGRLFSGDFAEILIYNHALNSSDILTVENYLKSKYGL
jgi:hypothetical protein